MSKYNPLRSFLFSTAQPRITMSFDQIAALVGPLPRSAYEYQAWWANELEPRTHVQKIAWMKAGYLVERFDLTRRTVTFASNMIVSCETTHRGRTLRRPSPQTL